MTVGLTGGITSVVSDELLLPLDELPVQRNQAALEAAKNAAVTQT